MMTENHSAQRMDYQAFRGKHPLPGPFFVGIRIFFLQGIGKRFAPVSYRSILVMQPLYSLQMDFQRLFDLVRQYGRSVLLSFSRPNDQQIIGKIDVLDSQVDALQKAEAASIEQLSHEKIGALEKGKEAVNLFAS
jgi:hypothetical protein